MKPYLHRIYRLPASGFGHRPASLVQAGVALALVAALAGACGSGPTAEPTTEPATVAPTAAPLPTDVPTEAATATEMPSATAAATEAPTRAPKPTAIPVTAAPATAAPTQAPTAAPAAAWSVDFYPDNWTYQLDEDQLCAGVNWTSTGVTELKFGVEGSGGEKVEAAGRKGDLCFGEKEADFFLEYRKPDGQIERKTIHLERDK